MNELISLVTSWTSHSYYTTSNTEFIWKLYCYNAGLVAFKYSDEKILTFVYVFKSKVQFLRCGHSLRHFLVLVDKFLGCQLRTPLPIMTYWSFFFHKYIFEIVSFFKSLCLRISKNFVCETTNKNTNQRLIYKYLSFFYVNWIEKNLVQLFQPIFLEHHLVMYSNRENSTALVFWFRLIQKFGIK